MPEAQMLKTCKQDQLKGDPFESPNSIYHRRDIVVIVVNS
jgi:hypothetical protein